MSPHGTIAAGVVERSPALIACLAALLASALILFPAAGDRFDTGTGAAGIPADPLQPLIGLATDAGAAAPAGAGPAASRARSDAARRFVSSAPMRACR